MAAAASGAVALSFAVTASPAAADDGTTLYVATGGSTAADGCGASTNPCGSVEDAVARAFSGDTIEIGAGTFTGSATSHLQSLTIRGAGETQTILRAPAGGSTVLHLTGSTDAPGDTVADLSVQGAGDAGIEIDGSATLDDVLVQDNDIGVDFRGTLAVSGSTVTGNGDAGIVGSYEFTELTLAGTTVSNNGADHTVGIEASHDWDGAGVLTGPGSTDTIVASTISGNGGDGVATDGGAVSITNSTLAGNGVANSDGSYLAQLDVQGAEDVDGEADVTASTISSPSTSTGLLVDDGSADVAATIIAADGGASACTLLGGLAASELVGDGGDNLATDNTCALSATGSHNSVDPELGSLADNGGPTETMLPGTGSPVIDAIASSSPLCQHTDQRGVRRPAGSGCDIGAVEVSAGSSSSRAKSSLKAAPGLLVLSPLQIPLGQLQATLRGPNGPLSGKHVIFKVGSSRQCDVTTNARGVATCPLQLLGLVGMVLSLGYHASFTGDAGYQPSSAAGQLIG
jgi:hypothetical protein